MSDGFALLIGQHRHDHFGNVAEMRRVLRQINPTRHVMGWRDPLDLLVATEIVLGIFETETEQ